MKDELGTFTEFFVCIFNLFQNTLLKSNMFVYLAHYLALIFLKLLQKLALFKLKQSLQLSACEKCTTALRLEFMCYFGWPIICKL